jgi:hypothetical protein
LNKTTLIFGFCFAFGSAGLHQAAAQAAPGGALPSSNVAHNTGVGPSRPAPPPFRQSMAEVTSQQPDQTKVVRIYGGAGYFDAALAEKLRPILARTFNSTSRTLTERSHLNIQH